VLILWDISTGTSLRILPVYEGIEGTFMISAKCLPSFVALRKSDGIYVASAGEKGMLTIETYLVLYLCTYTRNKRMRNVKSHRK
jgi:hypothetical protein